MVVDCNFQTELIILVQSPVIRCSFLRSYEYEIFECVFLFLFRSASKQIIQLKIFSVELCEDWNYLFKRDRLTIWHSLTVLWWLTHVGYLRLLHFPITKYIFVTSRIEISHSCPRLFQTRTKFEYEQHVPKLPQNVKLLFLICWCNDNMKLWRRWEIQHTTHRKKKFYFSIWTLFSFHSRMWFPKIMTMMKVWKNFYTPKKNIYNFVCWLLVESFLIRRKWSFLSISYSCCALLLYCSLFILNWSYRVHSIWFHILYSLICSTHFGPSFSWVVRFGLFW